MMADAKTGEGRRHCWHTAWRSHPMHIPEERQVCCHCGVMRRNGSVAQTGHGRYASPVWLPGEWSYVGDSTTDVCEGGEA
jgi:hypothetical protein